MDRKGIENKIVVLCAQGETFIIHYLDHQYATRQGTVQWLATHETLGFRSNLELIRILDSAVASEGCDALSLMR